MRAFVTSYLTDAGRDEDGSPVQGETFVVWVETSDGRRWEHVHGFPRWGWKFFDEADMHAFVETDKRAEARAEALARNVNRAIKLRQLNLDNEHWHPIQPSYGSDAYVADRDYWEAQTEALDA